MAGGLHPIAAWRPGLAALSVLALLAGGCADTGTTDPAGGQAGTATVAFQPQNSSEADLKARAARLQATVFEAVAIGAGLGTGIGFTFGGQRGASFGLPIGAALGGGAGSFVAGRQREFSDREEALEALTADLANTNQQVAGLIAVMQDVVQQQRAEIAALRGQVANGQATQDQLQSAIAHARDNVAVMREATTDAQGKLGYFNENRGVVLSGASASEASALDSDIASLSQRISTMNALVADLSQEV